MAMQNPAPFTISAEDFDHGLVPLRTKNGRKIHLVKPNSASTGNSGIALCSSGAAWRSHKTTNHLISKEAVLRGTVQITCIRCLKIYEFN